MCGLTAGQRGRRVRVLDHAERPGKKILMSGGGRCNFTNTGTTPANFLSANPHFCKSALARYTQWDFIDLINRYGIAYHEKTLGQLFCDGSARQIVAMLLDECDKGRVDIALGQAIGGVAPTGHPAPLTTVVDEALAAYPEIWAAGGTPHTVFPLTFDDLVRLTGGTVLKVD